LIATPPLGREKKRIGMKKKEEIGRLMDFLFPFLVLPNCGDDVFWNYVRQTGQ